MFLFDYECAACDMNEFSVVCQICCAAKVVGATSSEGVLVETFNDACSQSSVVVCLVCMCSGVSGRSRNPARPFFLPCRRIEPTTVVVSRWIMDLHVSNKHFFHVFHHPFAVPTLKGFYFTRGAAKSTGYQSYDKCLEVRRDNNQNCSVLCCVRQLCTMIRTNT